MTIRFVASGGKIVMLAICTLLVFCNQLTAADPAPSPSLGQRLAEAAREAKSQFRPFTKADVDRNRDRLNNAVAALQRRLDRDGENGRNWARFVRLDELKPLLSADAPDLARLREILGRFDSGHEGLGLVCFRDVEAALQRYVETAAGIGDDKVAAQYASMMESLAERLPVFAEHYTPQDATAIGRALRWLEDARQAPELLHLVRADLEAPNLFIEVQAALITEGVNEPVDDVEPIRDCILGTSVSGTGHTVGALTATLVPNDQMAVIDALFFGRTSADSIGRNGPATICSSSSTDLASRKRIWLTADGFRAHPSAGSAQTSTTIESISAKRRIVQRIAWKRAGQQKSLAESIASQHAVGRLNARVDARAAGPLADANATYETKFRQPLLERGLFPNELRFASESDRLRIVALQSKPGQLAGCGAPPPPLEHVDLAMRVHESMVNNSLATALAGMTVRDESFRKGVVEWLGRVPEQLKPQPDEGPLAVSFAADQPITTKFDEGRITITVCGDRYLRDRESYPGMYVTAEYAIEDTPKGPKLMRQGDLEILPPGFEPGGTRRLTARQIAIRTILARRFGKLFEPEIELQGIELQGRLAKLGRLMPTVVKADHHWLSIGWVQAANASPQRTAAAAKPKELPESDAQPLGQQVAADDHRAANHAP